MRKIIATLIVVTMIITTILSLSTALSNNKKIDIRASSPAISYKIKE